MMLVRDVQSENALDAYKELESNYRQMQISNKDKKDKGFLTEVF